MEKRYTMEEFKKKFDDAELNAIEKLENEFKEAIEKQDKKVPAMAKVAYTMQNAMAMAELEKELFKEKN